ncbi:Pyridoxine/pyridoxamine 5'-phosphate oxidase [Sphingomonas antarctica]|uniref:pyridoxamine 5'-phosphate oxidase n=1 Tax=Sphingomonas antarctica TaxID=2040274 RepID=UPI0039E8B4B7
MTEHDPIARFRVWLAEAEVGEPNDPNAVALATADADGRPSVRMVLLKGLSEAGFVFYTNQHSRKGAELAVNPHAALLFHWKSLRRQVRVEGLVEAVSDAEADAYFASRGRESRLGAWASDQSATLPDRATLETRLEDVKARFGDGDVPRPPHWSGYRVVPQRIEFWSDGSARLHHRELFERNANAWTMRLLNP